MNNNSTYLPATSQNITKSSSSPNKKPVYVTLQKIGNGFSFVQQSASAVSKIPKLSRTIPSTTLLTNKVAPRHPALPKNQADTVMPTIAITTKTGFNKPNYSRTASIAASSITISKKKPAKKTYSKKQPNELATTKFNFPPPPPKADFKVSTLTKFKTAIDDERTIVANKGTTPIPICGDTTGVPVDCRLFKKLTIDTATSKADVPSVDVPSKTIRRFSSDDLREAIENVDFSCQSQSTSDVIADSVNHSNAEPSTDQQGLGEIIKRLDRVEALQLAAAKRDAQILVAVKKLCLAYTKYNDDNNEIKKMLPMKNPDQFEAMDIQLSEDHTLIEKFRSYLRGYKTSNDPNNFSSMLSVLMTDELVDKYNYKGIVGKRKLEGNKIMDIIHDLHKPMDIKTFEKLMRDTIDLAKNRYHNDQYRKRQLAIQQSQNLSRH